MPSLFRLVALASLLLVATLCRAQADEMEVISLKYRTAEQMIPVLRPLAEPGGAVTGMQNTLVVRGSRRTIENVKAALASLDRMPRRLLISVRQDAGADVSASGGVAGGTIGTGGSRVDARVYSSRGASDERVSQTVQVLEGNPARIMVGQSVRVTTQTIQAPVYPPGYPVPGGAGVGQGQARPGLPPGYGGYGGGMVGESVTYRDVATGFTVVPRVAGDRVTLDINPQMQGAQIQSGVTGSGGQNIPVFQSQTIATTASGRLGEWIDLGGMVQDDRRSERGVLSSQQAARQDNRRVWVKVEELP